MINNFKWSDFCLLADSLIDNNNEAKQRTSISRYYYGCFCPSRDLYLKKSYF